MRALDPDIKDERIRARTLYWSGWRTQQIADALGIPRPTIQTWKRRDCWDAAAPLDRAEAALESRFIALVTKESKDGKDFKEIDLLGRQMERAARVRKYLNGGNEVDLNPKVANRNAAPKKKPRKNIISDAQAQALREKFDQNLFAYQRAWRDAGQTHRIRDILKSRQIGATWYFAREALIDAIDTGRNQIFLSASKAQASIFKEYIVAFGKEADVELTGSPITLENDASLYFLSTNAKTAQSYHGNLYFDEYFWVSNFAEIRKVASGMALHKKWRQTYFSTPSSQSHAAYAYWNGDRHNARLGPNDRQRFDCSHAALKNGRLGPDNHWRQIVTLDDAIAGGCNLFDPEQLKLEYSADEYANLLLCQFIDDTASVFPLSLLMRATVDTLDTWNDFNLLLDKPLGETPVWIGYDPAGTGDAAALVVVAPPPGQGGKFRLLEKQKFHGMDFAAQADAIKNACRRYNVAYIGIDATGLGQGVYQIVRQFFPAVEGIQYAVDKKVAMVLKGIDVFQKNRIEFDAGWTDLIQSFMAIRRTVTESGRQITFKADRGRDISHADLAWATLHALSHEPLEGRSGENRGFIELF